MWRFWSQLWQALQVALNISSLRASVGSPAGPLAALPAGGEPQKLRAGGHQGFPRTIDMDDPNGEMALALKAPPGLYTQYGQNGNSSTTGCQI